MTIKVAINGYGRIGRQVLRAIYDYNLRGVFEVVGVNASGDLATNAHLTKFDTVHGRFGAEVSHQDNALVINGDVIPFFSTRNPAELPWKELAVGWVLAGYLLSKRNSWLLMFLGMALFAVLCLSQKMVVVRRVASGQANQWVVTHVYDPKEVLFVEGKEYFSAEIARARALLGESAPTVITTREGVAQLSDDFVVFTHQVACQCVRQIAGGRAALLTSWQQAAEDGKGKPLQIYLKINTLNPRGTAGVRVGSAEWSFGPYKQGTYWVDTTDFGTGLPSQGSHRFYSAVPKWRIRIRYTAPQGWTVETPELTLPLAQGAEVRWEKPPQP